VTVDTPGSAYYINASHQDLVTLTWFMADNGYSAQDIAYAVEKPWKHVELLDEAKRAQEQQ
jgi:hypothetical protein